MPSAAFFDVDGTLLNATVVHYYVFLRARQTHLLLRPLWLASFLPRVPYYFALDCISRSLFNRRFYRNYRGYSPTDLERAAGPLYTELIKPRLYPEAVSRIRQHQERGDEIVLVSGSLRPLLEPLAYELKINKLFAAELAVQDDVYTGRLTGGPLTAERKGEAIRKFIEERNFDPAACSAYADSLDDREMLSAVGKAYAVNPGRRMVRLAEERGWEVLSWKQSNM